MRSEINGVTRRVALLRSGIVAGALALFALLPNAFAASLGPVGTYTPSTKTFKVDTNRDGTADVTLVFGVAGDIGLLTDVQGTGTKTPTTFNNGTWTFSGGGSIVKWGGAGDVPLAGDVSGSGSDALVVYRNGTWFVSGAGNGIVTAIYSFGGQPGDIPLLADINGDGKADLIIYRAGAWYVSTNRDGIADTVFMFGGSAGDVPVAFDYDGNGTADPGVFNNGTWSISTAHTAAVGATFSFGAAGDTPLFAGTGTGGVPRLIASAGTPQTAQVSTPFLTNLAVTARDGGGNAVAGVNVTFAAPGSGASATFAGGVNTATTNAVGVATAQILTANATVGSYIISASANVAGTATTASFSLTNSTGTGAPTIAATAGAVQSAAVSTAYLVNLQATVKDGTGAAMPNVTVTFTAPPASGASGTFAGGVNTATTDASGNAVAPVFTANATAGTYVVTASATGVATQASFSLTNFSGTQGANDAARFLGHATFGPTAADIASVNTMGMSAWVDAQFLKPATPLPVFAAQPENAPANCTSPLTAGGPADPFGTNCPRDLYSTFAVQRYFFLNALTAQDQLRQRVAWALSQIIVTSATQDSIAFPMRDYAQLLQNLAFDNYQNILTQVSISPWMGNYLDMVNNAKANAAAGTNPNENYAREIMQLFSIGLNELNNDGTLLLDGSGNPIPTYVQSDVSDMAKLFTGWTYAPIAPATLNWNAPINYATAMLTCEGPGCGNGSTNFHDTTLKSALGTGFPATLTANQDLQLAVNAIFTHPNVGPFIGKQLIQLLVMSNPSPAYVNRVAGVFNNNGSGVRGDMKAVIKAVLVDTEALAPLDPVDSKASKLKEPVMMMTSFLRAMGANSDGVYPLLQTPNMGQPVYQSPTVFNYYPADYVVPGTAALNGPQFGIYTAPTFFARVNTLYALTLGASCGAAPNNNLCGPNADATVANSVGTKIDYSSLAAAANNVPALVQQVNNTLMFGTMPPAMAQQIVTAVNAVPTSTPITAAQLLARAQTAVYLTITSPQYQVEY